MVKSNDIPKNYKGQPVLNRTQTKEYSKQQKKEQVLPRFKFNNPNDNLDFIEILKDLTSTDEITSPLEILPRLEEISKLANDISWQNSPIEISEDMPQWLKDFAAFQIYDHKDIDKHAPTIHSFDEVEQKFQLISALTNNPTSFENLCTFYQECQEKSQQDIFKATWHNYLLIQENELNTIPATQKFELVQDRNGAFHTKHSLIDIDDTKLDVCLIDGKTAYINLKQYKQLTPEQFSALKKISSKLKITDLSKMDDVYTYIAEKNKLIPLNEALENPKSQPEKTTIPHSQKQNKSSDFAATTNPNYKDDDRDLDSYDFIVNSTPKENSHDVRKDARKKSLEKLQEGYGGAYIKRTIDWGGYTVRVYSSEDDYLEDGKVTRKDGKKKQTKQFAFRVKNGNPPSAAIFLGKKTELKANDVAPILKDFAARGYDTFVMPDANVMTKSVFKAFLEASLTTGVIPQLKQSDDDTVGMKLNSGDVGDLLKAWEEKKTNQTPEKRIQMSLRLSQQLAGYAKTKDGRKENLAPKAQKLLMEARFEKFSSSYLASIQAFANNKVETKVDLIAYKYALGQLTKNISQGKLPVIENDNIKTNNNYIVFQTFDPMDANNQNSQLIEAAINSYMEIAKPKIKEDLDMSYQEATLRDEQAHNIRQRAMNEVDKKYTAEYNQIIADIVSNGADEKAIKANQFPSPSSAGHNFNQTQQPQFARTYRSNTR